MNSSFVAVCAMLCVSTCFAQTSGPASAPVSDFPAYPRIRGSYGAIGASFFYENDGGYIKPFDITDQWYTAGAGGVVQWQSIGTTSLVSSLPSIGGEFDYDRPKTGYAAGILFSLNIYTPADISDPDPIYDDRPYAGWTYGGLLVQRSQRESDTPTFESFELDVGTLGPQSRAGSAQKWIHEAFAQIYPEGWNYQVDNEFGADFKYQRRWRVELAEPGTDAFGVDLIPDAGVTLGTVHINASAGATLRAGWQLPDDFGPAKMQAPGDFTGDYARGNGVRGIGGYFFVRPGITLVAHDATFGDSFFRDNMVSQNTDPVVVQATFGACLLFWDYWQLSYSQTFVSPEFADQDRWHSYATLGLSFAYAW